MSRSCFPCTMCCWLPEVPSLKKPCGEWCPHVTSTGCGIYDKRPGECKTYDCLWIKSEKMGVRLRPDLCHVIFEPHWDEGFVLALVDPNFPSAWRRSPAFILIQRLNRDGHPVVVQSRASTYYCLPDGMTQEEVQRRIVRAKEKVKPSAQSVNRVG